MRSRVVRTVALAAIALVTIPLGAYAPLVLQYRFDVDSTSWETGVWGIILLGGAVSGAFIFRRYLARVVAFVLFLALAAPVSVMTALAIACSVYGDCL